MGEEGQASSDRTEACYIDMEICLDNWSSNYSLKYKALLKIGVFAHETDLVVSQENHLLAICSTDPSEAH